METHNPLPIFAFGNMRFARVAENWLIHILKLRINEFKVFCHDDDLQRFLAHRFPEHSEKFVFNSETAFEIDPTNLSLYFKFRKVLFRKLLLNHTEYIFSDLDAIWLSDVRNTFREPGADMVLQKVVHNFACPLDIRWKTGYTGCLGLWYMKKTPELLDFLIQFIEDKEPHDQVSFNRILFKKEGAKQLPDKKGHVRILFRGVTFGFADPSIIQRPYYRRHFNSWDRQGVVHPVVKEGTRTIDTLMKFNLWRPISLRSCFFQILEASYRTQRKVRKLK